MNGRKYKQKDPSSLSGRIRSASLLISDSDLAKQLGTTENYVRRIRLLNGVRKGKPQGAGPGPHGIEIMRMVRSRLSEIVESSDGRQDAKRAKSRRS